MRKFLIILGLFLISVGAGCIGAWAGLDEGMELLLIIGFAILLVGVVVFILTNVISSKTVKKNRTNFFIESTLSKDELQEKLTNFFETQGYQLINYLDEKVYRKGNGVITGRRFLKYEFAEGGVNVECWISTGIGNAVTTETPLNDSGFGWVLKKEMREMIGALELFLKN